MTSVRNAAAEALETQANVDEHAVSIGGTAPVTNNRTTAKQRSRQGLCSRFALHLRSSLLIFATGYAVRTPKGVVPV